MRLSIGNYISFINRNCEVHIPQTYPLKIMDISLFKIEACQIDELFAQVEKPIILDNRDVCGIPLTKGWLLKFGFELFPWGWVKDEILIRHIQYKKFWIELGNGKRIYFPHIHTLQNFFALTGKELTE